jgi:hypothetical protein
MRPGAGVTGEPLGTVTWRAAGAGPDRPQSRAAVWWLSTARGPARKTAAHRRHSSAGTPLNVAYTPGCSRCQRPRRRLVAMTWSVTPADRAWERVSTPF